MGGGYWPEVVHVLVWSGQVFGVSNFTRLRLLVQKSIITIVIYFTTLSLDLLHPIPFFIMLLPSQLKQNLLPSEINFLAENEYIQILPRYSMKSIQLIGTKIPNLRALRREKVPIWVALILKSQGKCNIVPPDWLNLIYLKEKYDQEMKSPMAFSDLPWNWIEVSKMLLAKAPDDLPDASHQLRSLLQDLREIRQVKTRKGLKEVNESNIALNGLSLMEINEVRPFMLSVMNRLRELHDTIEEENPEIELDDEE